MNSDSDIVYFMNFSPTSHLRHCRNCYHTTYPNRTSVLVAFPVLHIRVFYFQLSDANEFVRKMNVVSTGGEDKKAEEKAEAEAAAEKRKKPANQGWGRVCQILI